MNRISHCVLTFLFFCVAVVPLSAQGPAANGKQLPKYMVNPEALNTPEFKAMVEEAEDFLNNLSEDEMKEFMSFYEEFLKGVENGEIDLAEYLPKDILQPLTPEQAEALLAQEEQPAPPSTPTPAPVAVPPTAIEDVNDAIAMINAIIGHIETIFTKAESDPTISASLTPWKERLSKLIVYLRLLSAKKHIQRLFTDAEHKGVLDVLKDLRQQLSIYEPQITVPEFGLGVLQKQEKEVSKRALQKAMEAIDTAITTKEVMQQIEKIFAKYEPEALKKAQDMLAAQERAKKPVAAAPAAPHVSLISPEPRAEGRARGHRYEPNEYPDYSFGGRERPFREEPSFWSEPTERAKPGGKEGTKATTLGSAKGKKPEEGEKGTEESAKKEAATGKGKGKEKEKAAKEPVTASAEAKKLIDAIDKSVDTIIEELLPDNNDKLKTFMDQLLEPSPSPALEKLTAITDELGRLSRKNGQFKGLSKQSAGDAATAHAAILKKLSSKLVPLYTNVKGITLPAKLDTPHAQAIDTFIKTCDLIFPNFRAIKPTTTYKLKKAAPAAPAGKKGKKAEDISEQEAEEDIELEEEAEEAGEEAAGTTSSPQIISAKATVQYASTPMSVQDRRMPGNVNLVTPTYMPQAPGAVQATMPVAAASEPTSATMPPLLPTTMPILEEPSKNYNRLDELD